jgi:hypothetical protein
MAAAKTKKRGAKAAPARPRPKVLVFALGDVTAARHAIPFFDLQPKHFELGYYALEEEHDGRSTLFEAIPEPRIPRALNDRVHALLSAVVTLLTEASGAPIRADDLITGYHASATYEEVVARFTADGFEVLEARDLARGASKARDPEASRDRLARASRAMGKDADAITLGAFALDDAIETWSDVEEHAFDRVARARALGDLPRAQGWEPVGVDRWGMLSESLARAGFSAQDVEDVWLHAIMGKSWPSATWFAMAMLSRLAPIARRILSRADRIEPARPLSRLLIEPLEELPSELVPFYQSGVERLLDERDIRDALPEGAWESLVESDKAVFGPLAAKAKRKLPSDRPAALAPSPRLAAIQARYRMDFPDELLAIWDLARSLSPKRPRSAFSDALLGITLVGPFDLLAGDTKVKAGLDVRLHWRYRSDPPEFFTVARGGVDGLHFGYWFDDPARGASCVASYYARDAFDLEVLGLSLGEALRFWLERGHSEAMANMARDRKHEAEYARDLGSLASLRAKLRAIVTSDRPEIGGAYVARYERRGLRERTSLQMTPEGMGVVAPAASYRPLSLAGEELSSALASARQRKAIVEEALELCSAGAPATALLLGKVCWAEELDEEAYTLLDAGYAGLGRPGLRETLAVHRANRDLQFVDVLEH